MKTVGGQKLLTEIEEENLVNVLVAVSDYGSPMTKLDLKMLVFNYLEKNSRSHIFNGKMPGNTWVENFLNRHSSKLSVRTTQNIKKVRAEKGLLEMQNFFDNLQATLKDIPPSNILNYDETNLSDNPSNLKCIFRRGIKYPERILNSSKSCVSIMFTVSAAGDCLPTYVVYKATNLYSEWVDGGPDGTRYNCTKSGWFDSACFEDYFRTIILKWAKNLSGPKVIIGDNLSSHLNIEVVELCQKYDIRESNNIKSGFRAAGIWPVNARNVLKRIPEYFDEEVYRIDSALLDYLQKTRCSKPMAVKRSKKLRTEPGKSVCAADILIKTTSNKSVQNKKSKRFENYQDNFNDIESSRQDCEINILEEVTTERDIEENELVLDDKIGFFLKNTPEHIETTQKIEHEAKIEKGDKENLPFIVINDNDLPPCLQSTNQTNVIITSNVKLDCKERKTQKNLRIQIDAGAKVITQSALKMKLFTRDKINKINNDSSVTDKNNEYINMQKEENTTRKRKSMTRTTCVKREKRSKINKIKTKSRKTTSVNKKKFKKNISESSSEISDFQLSIAESDDSEYETLNDYIKICLQDQSEKENLEPDPIPFGISDIEYFTGNVDNLNEGDWLIAKFATKKKRQALCWTDFIY
ncbi:unnamed protein product [Parnassius apollo]|uniref:(apollo) hypothetical protein n=1 Tax=Parnassius apollo TaxID=110799 RepID=A0A8S3X764_PARAO|nr:unnamed protein product [Parnassius apollo]